MYGTETFVETKKITFLRRFIVFFFFVSLSFLRLVIVMSSFHPQSGLILSSIHPRFILIQFLFHPRFILVLFSFHPRSILVLSSLHPRSILVSFAFF